MLKYRSVWIGVIGTVVIVTIVGMLFLQGNICVRRSLGLPFPRFIVRSLGVTYLGVSSLLIDDRCDAIMIDGFFTRPNVSPAAANASLTPDDAAITAALHARNMLIVGELDLRRQIRVLAVVVNHTHYDHAMDSAIVAKKTGAALVGSASLGKIAEGLNLGSADGSIPPLNFPMQDFHTISGGEVLTFGPYTVTTILSGHVPIFGATPFAGTIGDNFRPPQRLDAYKEGGTFSILIAYGNKTMLVQGSAGFRTGALQGRRAQVAYVAVGGLGLTSSSHRDNYWNEVVAAVQPQRIFPIHWDDPQFVIDWNGGTQDPPLENFAQQGIDFLTNRAAPNTVVNPRVLERINPFP